MKKKTYIAPIETVLSIGEQNMLCVSAGQGEGGGLDTFPKDPNDGEEMVKEMKFPTVWDKEW